ncbi:MAG: heme NO-binding domain-containing protein [Bacteroidales bacterium]|nr:heme NO-binding domain-containing protein [Bacteroidales bacterium]
MKGTIVKAAERMIISTYGVEKWEEILYRTGFEKDHVFLIRDDVSDDKVMGILKNSAQVLNISKDDLLSEYAKYWIFSYISEVYPSFQFSSAREFIKNIPSIHDFMTESVLNATPPVFEFDWINENELILTYISSRGLIELAKNILSQIGEKYNTKINIEKIDEKRLKLIFT